MNISDLKLPIILLGMKTDILTTINDEKLLDYMNYKCRKLSIENECTLLSMSSF